MTELERLQRLTEKQTLLINALNETIKKDDKIINLYREINTKQNDAIKILLVGVNKIETQINKP